MTTETFDDADAQIARLSNELDKAREVLLEVDKIVAGHVAKVERLETELAAQTELSGSALNRCAELAERLTGLRALNAKMMAALKDAVRYLEYLNGETGGMFIGPGMPADALAQTRAVIADAEGQS